MSDIQTRIDSMRIKMKERGCRITPQRLAILAILAESKGHPSVEGIYERVKANFPTTSIATVYKTVSVLKELGEVLELEFSHDHNRYDGARPYPHPHLICTKCGKILDPAWSRFEDMTERLASDTGFKITTHRLEFFGVCPECQNGE
jgi:Fur family peroxide stress response transcriptional regulator